MARKSSKLPKKQKRKQKQEKQDQRTELAPISSSAPEQPLAAQPFSIDSPGPASPVPVSAPAPAPAPPSPTPTPTPPSPLYALTETDLAVESSLPEYPIDYYAPLPPPTLERTAGTPLNPTRNRRDYCARALDYCLYVVNGYIPACKWIKLACQRQLNDLLEREDRDPDFPYLWSTTLADLFCDFFERLPHIKGSGWETKNVVIEDWQCFMFTTIFGWVDKTDAYRRFRKAGIWLPRKNGKSFCASAVALYLLSADCELGAEVVSAAVTRDQAKIVWETSRDMVRKSKDLQARGVQAMAHFIFVPDSSSTFKPVSRDADSLEGLHLHGAIIDELHAHKTREVYDVLDQATGARSQPLIFIISTAGDNRHGIGYEHNDTLHKILDGRLKDDSYFGVDYTLDVEDDAFAPESMAKANPNYGISIKPKNLDEARIQAQRSAAAQNTYLTKRLNIWVSTGISYFNMLAWQNRCKVPQLKLEDFYGRPCIMALDLASKIDVAVKLFLFDGMDDKDHNRYVFCQYFMPESSLDSGNANYDLYNGWFKEGLLTTTPGNILDFDFIEEQLVFDCANFQVREIAYDPFQATQLATTMAKEGLPMVEVGATVKNFSEPMKLLEGIILAGAIKHNGDPMLDWMLSNVYAQLDQKDNVYPRKAQRENKIDGAVALIMALSRDIVKTESVYQTGGLRIV